MNLLDLLNNIIDIHKEPFSDIGSRLLVYKDKEKSELIIKLAERLTRIEPGLGTYLKRPPFIENLCFLDDQGERLDFKTKTSPYLLTFQTQKGDFHLCFADEETLVLGLPDESRVGISFYVNHSYIKTTANGLEIKKVKNFAIETQAEILKQVCCPSENGDRIVVQMQTNRDATLAIRISDQENLQIDLQPYQKYSSSAKKRWQQVFESLPPVLEQYQQKYAFAWWVLLNNIVTPKGILKRRAVMPSKAYYLGAWLWDNALHAIALRHLDIHLAQEQIKLMLDHQLPDGMLPDAIYDEGVVSEIDHPIHARVTKPPILAWAAFKVYESQPDIDFLKEIYPALIRENSWWFAQNDIDANGLVEYAHPYSSGLDDNPLWDGEMPVESPDINTYLILQMESLAKMAAILVFQEEAAVWKRRADSVTERMIASMWDEKKGFFWATHNNQRVMVTTPFNLLPLWTGNLSKEMAAKVIDNLTNPDLFGGEWMLPTVARSDPKFDPEKMWRGPIWANINYFFVEALQRNNQPELAKDLALKTINLINQQAGIYEYYNPLTGIPPETAAPVFSWTAAVFIDLAIQISSKNKN